MREQKFASDFDGSRERKEASITLRDSDVAKARLASINSSTDLNGAEETKYDEDGDDDDDDDDDDGDGGDIWTIRETAF